MLTPADHALALLIVVGLPLRAFLGMRALRAADVASLRTLRRGLWRRAIASQWLLVGLVLVVWLTAHRSPISLGLGVRPTGGLVGVLVGLATIVSLVLRQRGAIATDESLRARARERLQSVERLMPHEPREFPEFALLAVTAGICEELLFRGFLLWYGAHFISY